MKAFFPEVIDSLPEADIPIDGLKSRLFQGEHQQIIFMEFDKDVEVPEHSHESQWGVVLKGKMELTVEGKEMVLQKGDTYFTSGRDEAQRENLCWLYGSDVFQSERQVPSKINSDGKRLG